MTTMHEQYGDGSDHEVCPTCGLCMTCKDCECTQDTAWPKEPDMEPKSTAARP